MENNIKTSGNAYLVDFAYVFCKGEPIKMPNNFVFMPKDEKDKIINHNKLLLDFINSDLSFFEYEEKDNIKGKELCYNALVYGSYHRDTVYGMFSDLPKFGGLGSTATHMFFQILETYKQIEDAGKLSKEKYFFWPTHIFIRELGLTDEEFLASLHILLFYKLIKAAVEKPEKGKFTGNYGKARGYAHFSGKNTFT